MPSTGLTSEVGNELRRQQVLLLTQQLPVMAIVNALNGGLLTLIFADGPTRIPALSWYGFILFAAACQLHTWLRLRNKPLPQVVSGRSLDRAMAFSGAMGIAWGVTCFLFWRAENVYAELIIVLMIAGMAAGTTSLLNPIPKVAIAFLIGILLPFVARATTLGGSLHYVMTVLAFVFAFALTVGSLRSYRHMVALIASARAVSDVRADLFDAIEASRDAIGHFDSALRLVAANKRFNEWFPDPISVTGDDETGRVRAVGADRWVVSKLLPTSRGGFVSVHTDITDIKVREEQIEGARLSAEEASRAKSAFIEQVGATLRSPMEDVVRYLGAVPAGDDAARDAAAAKALMVLEAVSDIADVSTIDSQSYEYRFAFIDARALVEWSVKAAAARYGRARDASIKVVFHDEIPDLVCDARAMKRTLMHLIVNALENTPHDREVGVDVRKAHDGQAEICVWDYGCGMAPDMLDRVQRLASGEDESLSTDLAPGAGMGLGLKIASRVIRQHRGALKILSEPTLGTFAYVKLPYRASVYALPANDAAAARDLDMTSDASAGSGGGEGAFSAEATTGTGTALPLRSTKRATV